MGTLQMCLSMLFRCVGLPRFIPRTELPGPHPVSFVRERITFPAHLTAAAPSSVLALVVYPCARDQPPPSGTLPRGTGFEPYWRVGAAEGIASYSHAPAWLFRHLSASRHPCAPPGLAPARALDERNPEGVAGGGGPSGGWPVIVFSHGLAGCADMYVQLCRCLASLGYVVIAIEHEDRSGCYATTPNKTSMPRDTSASSGLVAPAASNEEAVLTYLQPDASPYSRAKVLGFRAPFLLRRVAEVKGVLEALGTATSSANGSAVGSPLSGPIGPTPMPTAELKGPEARSAALGAALRSCDRSRVHFVGHSFGAATVALAAQELRSASQSSLSSSPPPPPSSPSSSGAVTCAYSICVVRSVALLDAWAFCLPDDRLDRGTGGLPTLSILSEAWTTKDERPQVDQLVRACPGAETVVVPGAVHQSFSDSPLWYHKECRLPTFLSERFEMRGRGEVPANTHRTVAKIVHGAIERSALGSKA